VKLVKITPVILGFVQSRGHLWSFFSALQ